MLLFQAAPACHGTRCEKDPSTMGNSPDALPFTRPFSYPWLLARPLWEPRLCWPLHVPSARNPPLQPSRPPPCKSFAFLHPCRQQLQARKLFLSGGNTRKGEGLNKQKVGEQEIVWLRTLTCPCTFFWLSSVPLLFARLTDSRSSRKARFKSMGGRNFLGCFKCRSLALARMRRSTSSLATKSPGRF